jgi:hypothetical protein
MLEYGCENLFQNPIDLGSVRINSFSRRVFGHSGIRAPVGRIHFLSGQEARSASTFDLLDLREDSIVSDGECPALPHRLGNILLAFAKHIRFGFQVLSMFCFVEIVGCAEEFPEQKTVFVGKKTPDSLSWIRSRRSFFQGKTVVLRGRILRIDKTNNGCVLYLRAIPIGQDSFPVSRDRTGRLSDPGNTFMVRSPILHILGSPGPAPPEFGSDLPDIGRRSQTRIMPGNLVTVVGDVQGWHHLPGRDSGSRYLVLVGHYIERW